MSEKQYYHFLETNEDEELGPVHFYVPFTNEELGYVKKFVDDWHNYYELDMQPLSESDVAVYLKQKSNTLFTSKFHKAEFMGFTEGIMQEISDGEDVFYQGALFKIVN